MASRHRIDALVPEIERMLARGASYAQISRATGVSPGTIGAIRAQTRAIKTRPKTADERARDALVPAAPTIGRCPTCGGKCKLPCLACALRAPDPPPRPRTYRITSRPAREVLRSAFVALALCVAGAASAEPPELRLPLANIEVIDGDTIRADIRLPYDLVLVRQTIRADNFDAWESSRARRTVEITEAELAAGKKASADLQALIASSSQVWLVPGPGREPHGRKLGHWIVETADGEIDVGAWMRRRKHCRPGG